MKKKEQQQQQQQQRKLHALNNNRNKTYGDDDDDDDEGGGGVYDGYDDHDYDEPITRVRYSCEKGYKVILCHGQKKNLSMIIYASQG